MHFGGWGPAPVSDAGSPVAVHAVQGRKVHVPQVRPYRAPRTSWPAAQSATVSVAGVPVRAGDTPVYVGPAELAAPRTTAVLPPGGGQVRVSTVSRQATAALGVHGMVFTVAPAAGSAGGRVHVSVDYSGFAHAYGGDYASRLRLVELPACALTTPQDPSCRQQKPVTAAAADNLRTQRVGADVTLPGPAVTTAGPAVLLADVSSAGVVLAASAAPSGSGGNFTVTSFSDAGEWVNGTSSGTFSYDYPVRVPPVPGGFVPDVGLQYSSQLTDGLDSSTNNQASWIGDGWDYEPGFIETSYFACTSGTPQAGDLCSLAVFNTQAAPPQTLALNGTETPIVTGPGGEHAEADAGAAFSAGPNGSVLVTQPDGTKLYFGLNQLPGWVTGDPVTNSVWTVPVWNGTTKAYQTVPYRLMLDYEVDRHGNAIAFFYNQQSNWYAEAGGSTATAQYTRGGTLAKIWYGFQDGQAYTATPPGQVTFTTAGGRQDAPGDLACAQNAACSVNSPTFWNDQQLTTISTRALSGSAMQDADSWSLAQAFPATGDPLTGPSLWLSSVTQTGQDGVTAVTLPPTQFAPTASAMPGRIMSAADTAAGYSPVSRFRLSAITSPAGGVTTLAYTAQDPACASLSGPGTGEITDRCYPDSWISGTGAAVNDWFSVYAVRSKTVTDTTGGDPPVVTQYTYATPGWHYNSDTYSRTAQQTWDQWRGFRTVTTETGTAPDPVTETVDTYFQGLSKDCSTPAQGCTNAFFLTSSRGTTAEDKDGNAGMVFEEITYNGAGTGNQVSDTIHNASTTTTVTGSGFFAGVSAGTAADSAVTTYTALAGGGTRESTSSYTYDSFGNATAEVDEPDVNDSSQWTCATRTYGAFNQVTEDDIYSYVPVSSTNHALICPTLASNSLATSVAQIQAGAVSAVKNTYDSTGNLTQTQKGTGIIAAGTSPCPRSTPQDIHLACWAWQTTQTSTYDAYGRVLTSTDADNRATTTAYTPATGAEPTSVQVTDPMSMSTTTTYDPVRDLPLTDTDPAGYQTVKAYDALGRVTSEWTPGNPANGPAVDTYSYTDSNSAPSYVTGQAEKPGGGYLTTVTINDSLGQVRELQQQTASGGSDVTDTTYNSDGWKSLTSSPYYSSAAPSGTLVAAASGSVPSQTGSVYDGAGRVIRQIDYKNGAETRETDTTYGGNYTTVVPPAGGTSQTTFFDGRGLTTAMYQYHAGVTADPTGPASGYDKTTYTYNPAGQMAGAADAAGNSWAWTYNLLGQRLTQATPDAGTVTTAYDAAGQVMSVTDARGKTVSYTYDGDARKTAEYDTTGGALESAADQLASWTYDTLARGKLTSSTSLSGGAQYTQGVTGYNTQGLPSGTSVVIPSAAGSLAGTYTQTYTYAPDGVQTSYTDSADGGLPSETVTTGYDSAGNANSLTGATTYVTGLSYTTVGQPLQYTMGTTAQPVYITDSYDPETGQATEQNTQAGTSQASVDDLHYTYDQDGNVTSEADTPAAAPAATDVQCFQNDYLGRLVQAWSQGTASCASAPAAGAEGGAAPYWNTYAYNVTGALTSITSTPPAGTATTSTFTYPAPGSAHPHAPASEAVTGPSGTSTTTYGRDSAGDLTAITAGTQNQVLTWNTQGKLTQDAVTPAGGSAQDSTYTYDADGNLLLEADPGTTTLYLGDEELSLSGGTVTGTRYYDLGGVTVATRTSSGSIAYLAGDTQDTSAVAIDAATLNVTRRWYDPYGSTRGNVPASFPAGQKGFVGGTASTATGLTSLGAREYQPALGTFLSTDPVLNPLDPQDLNPYSYAKGNPATLSDPAGTCAQAGPGEPPINCAAQQVWPQVYYGAYGCTAPSQAQVNDCVAASQKAQARGNTRHKPAKHKKDQHKHHTGAQRATLMSDILPDGGGGGGGTEGLPEDWIQAIIDGEHMPGADPTGGDPTTIGATAAGGSDISSANTLESDTGQTPTSGLAPEPVPMKATSSYGKTEVPSWVSNDGYLPYEGETPNQAATRIMNEQYGEGNWEKVKGRGGKGPDSEYNKIKKWVSRHFR